MEIGKTMDEKVEQRFKRLEMLLQYVVSAQNDRALKSEARILDLSKENRELREAVWALHKKLSGFEIPILDDLGRREEAMYIGNCLDSVFVNRSMIGHDGSFAVDNRETVYPLVQNIKNTE